MQNIKLLPPLKSSYSLRNQTVNWFLGDSQDNYETSKRDNWYYNKPISYSFNSQGYRCQELDSVDWKNTWAFFGCSHMFGHGNAEEDTIPAIFTHKTGINSVNLGSCGAGNEHHFLNAVSLLSTVRPAGCVFLWTTKRRVEVYSHEGFTRTKDLLTHDKLSYVQRMQLATIYNDSYFNSEHSEVLNEHYKHTINQLTTAIHLQVSDFDNYPGVCEARDNDHNSWRWNELVADYIIRVTT